MKIKRVILNIDTELHSKLKQYADKDERTLNVVLRKILLAGVNALNIDLESSYKFTDEHYAAVNKTVVDSLTFGVKNVDKMTEEEREEALKEYF
jgi:BioD-like phosphotransacetylase family protein